MTYRTITIGDYYGGYDSESSNDYIYVTTSIGNKEYYGPVPSAEEWNSAFGVSGLSIDLSFGGKMNMVAAPTLLNEIRGSYNLFYNCASLIIPPKLPKTILTGRLLYCFQKCSSLICPAVIPGGVTNAAYFYENAVKLKMPSSIPPSVRNITRIYSGCVELEGEFSIKSTSITNKTNVLQDTVKPITIYGDQTICEEVAATANNGNASWQPWYDPVPAVTNRGQGSYTTAEDMTRMVRNGCLAVDSYAPGRMVYNQGDIVRQDEWEALVEAAQTIDPTVTMSTHYTNLNKIEKAFDDAL